MGIRIIRPGIFSTIQDMGRTGFRSLGIGPGGAMDFYAAALANFIAGNDENAALIEMHFPAAEILFDDDALISIAGANFDAHINEVPAKMMQPFVVKNNDVLSFKKNISGARVYVAVYGGVKAENWLGSFSTNIKVKAGGHHGRVLQKEDMIASGKNIPNFPVKNFVLPDELTEPVYKNQNSIRFTCGPEWELADDEAKKVFIQESFVISSRSDRMGCRLAGKNLLMKEQTNLVSSPVNFGTVQLLPDGQLIILVADHQTTGGYPRIANVIRADLPKLAQLPANAAINFKMVPMPEAEDALISLEKQMDTIKNLCKHFYAGN